MYTNEDLNYAIDQGIFSKESVDEFRETLESAKRTHFVDEENFKLVNSFNDIFVVIACGLLLFSALWAVKTINEDLGLLVFTVLSWGLAEFFILKRKMALPAIALLLSFVGGTFFFVLKLFGDTSEMAFVSAAGAAAVVAYGHWWRFSVPITMAAGAAALVGLVVSVILSINPDAKVYLSPALFVCGVMVFICAMYWDASDRLRTTRNSDVAFWLHLLSAPLIIHPIFSSLGIFDGSETMIGMSVVIILYVLMTLISLVVDRRAFMVSSLAYVIFAISNILKELGGLSYSFALTGIVIGSALLILSAYWHIVRVMLVNNLPLAIQRYVPSVNKKAIAPDAKR
ncbi:MAG: hypothetical protein K6L81_06735 [Agarilytica sp.]